MARLIKNNLIYFCAVVLFRVVNIIPRRMALFFGAVLGQTAYVTIKKERQKTLLNLDRAYSDDMTYRRKKEIARRCFAVFGRSAVEVMRFKRHFHRQISPDIEVIGEENFKRAYERGRGVIAFTGHIGNFELIAAYSAQSGYKSAAIGRELYDIRLDNMLTSNRADMGVINVKTDDSPRTTLKLLKDGYAIGFLIDTDSFRVAGELTPFFGRPAKTPTGPTQLGLMAKAAFVPIFCLSLPRGKYRLIFGEEIVPESYDRSRENIYRITRRMTKIIENLIRSYPEQWIWMHNRWHTRPENSDRQFLESIGVYL